LVSPGAVGRRRPSRRVKFLLQLGELFFQRPTAAEYGVHIAGRLMVLVIRPFVVIVVEVVVIEIRNHLQRAAGAVAAKISFSFHGQYRRPKMLARLTLEIRAIAMDGEFIPFDFEVDSVSSAPAHPGADLPFGAVRDLYSAFL